MQDRTEHLIDLFASVFSPESCSISPDGTMLAFELDVNGHSQIFALPTDKGSWPHRLTATLDECSDPQWSPDGKRLAYVRATSIVIANADGSEPRVLTDHPAGNTFPRWSPDGSRIAFYSRRRGWEHIWTISTEGSDLTQVTKGAFDGDDLIWSADSKWLAYSSIRDGDLMTRGVYLVPSRGGEEIRVSPRGGWSGSPHFSPDGKTLAYLSDHDGWFHTFLYDVSSSSTRQLSRDEIEDGGPSFYSVDGGSGPLFSPDGKHLALIRHRTGNFDVWIVGVDDGRSRCISRQDGHYRIVGWLPDGEHLVVSFEDTARPPDLTILSLEGEVRALTDSSVAEQHSKEMILPQWIEYGARDGLTIPAALLRPHNHNGAKAPAVIFLHGGPNFQFANFFYPLPELLAQAGYVVLAPNFRGSTGYGRAFRHANFGEWGHADALDVVDAALWLKSQSFVDPDHIAVAGPSYGGYLTLCALTLAPELFCAGIDLYGDSEIAVSYRRGDRYGRLDLQRQMGTPEENPEGYRRGSPVYLAERIEAPILILHGKEDKLVVPLMSERMIEALKIEGKYFESHFYEDEGHGFSKPGNKRDAWKRILTFLDRHCK